jgi:RNA polymerase sigma factor (sigma-70 family)
MFAKFYLDQTSPKEKGNSSELEDAALWQRFKSGNDLAFSILYKRYVQRLFNYGMHATNNRELVLDCIQELFGRLWAGKNQLADVQAVNFYLFKSFRRLLLSRLAQQRKNALQFLQHDDGAFAMLSSFEDAIILQEATAQQAEGLKKAIGTLTKRQREVIFLRFFNELSYNDVAAVMEMNVESVYNIMNKAIESLRKIVKRG